MEPFILDYRGKVKQKLEPKEIVPCLRAEAHGNHPLICGKYTSTYTEKEREIVMNGLTVNDFFCGAGGMGLGFKQAGFTIEGAWDFDKYAVESYKHNVGDHVIEMDITKMTNADVPKADVWTYGAPCQAFSVAGKGLGMMFKCPSCSHEEQFEGEMIIDRTTPCSKCGTQSKPKDPRGVLFFEVMRLLKYSEAENLPPVIMLENVKGISKFLGVVGYEYEKRGYKMYYTLFNSKYWGVPQNRERYFVVGVRKDIAKEFVFPTQQTEFIPKLSSVLEENVDEKYYISDLKAAKIIEQAKEGLRVKQATKLGYDVAVEGDSINISHPNSKTRRGRVGKQVAQTLLTGSEQVVVESLGSVHACITPDRVDRRQQGRRAKEEEEEPMFTVTAQDLHGIIVAGSLDHYGNDQMNRVYSPEGVSPTALVVSGGGREIKILEERKADIIGNIGNTGHGGENVYSPSGVAPTTKARDYKGPIKTVDGYRVRKLTPREYARLQGFPDSYEQVVSNSQFYKQMGNAVTVNVAEAIATTIKEFLG